MGDLIDFGNITINPSTKPYKIWEIKGMGRDYVRGERLGGTRKGDSMRCGLGRLQQEILATLDEAKGGGLIRKLNH